MPSKSTSQTHSLTSHQLLAPAKSRAQILIEIQEIRDKAKATQKKQAQLWPAEERQTDLTKTALVSTTDEQRALADM
jgi:hypothetical protein